MKWPWSRPTKDHDDETCQAEDGHCEEHDKRVEQEAREREINRRIDALESFAEALRERSNDSR